jgi:hypothetical protein
LEVESKTNLKSSIKGELMLGDGPPDPYPARLEAMRDTERPVSSGFTHGKRRKSDAFAAKDSLTEVAIQTW